MGVFQRLISKANGNKFSCMSAKAFKGQDNLKAYGTLPLYTDEVFVPMLWNGAQEDLHQSCAQQSHAVDGEVSVFHDCTLGHVSLSRQNDLASEEQDQQFVELKVGEFSGSFVSVSIKIPPQFRHELSVRHIVRLECKVQATQDVEVYTKLNIKHGPNKEEMVRKIQPDAERPSQIDFDLSYTRINEKRVEDVWLDISFSDPNMAAFKISDVMLVRRLRAEF